MKKIKNTLLALLLLYSAHSFGQWTEISIMEGKAIEVFNFINDDLGYAVMRDETSNAVSVVKTADGGSSWVEIDKPQQNGQLQDIYFYEEREGAMLIRDLNDDVTPTRIFRTMDDGSTWEDISPEATAKGVGVGQCQFLNENEGFFVTDRFLYATTDGGENWTSKEFDNHLIALDFLDAEHGVMGTWDGTFGYRGGMLTTADGGATWTSKSIDEHYTSIVEVQRLSPNTAYAAPVHGWAAIQAGRFYKTTDGGNTWNTMEIPMPESELTLRQIDFKDEMNGVACVGNTTTTYIYGTTDGGQTWVEEGTFTSAYNTELQLTPNSGYIGGKTGAFYKRSGSTFTEEALTKVDVRMYPSPVKSGQTIAWDSPQQFTSLLVVDPTGTIVHRQRLDQNQATLPQLPPSLYILQLRNQSSFATVKLVVE